MWQSRKYIGKHTMPTEESEPHKTEVLICPNCLMGELEIDDGVGICLNCGNRLDIDDFYTEADVQVSTNMLGQRVVTYTVIC